MSRLELKLEPFIATEKMNPQRCIVKLNETVLGALTLDPRPAAVYPFAIPPGVLQERNVLVLKLPDARSLRSLGLSTDSRRMALLVYEMRLVRDEITPPASVAMP
jgi:hypothetical protein